VPRRGQIVGGSSPAAGATMGVGAATGQVTYTWRGQRSLAQWQEVLETAFEALRDRAMAYWNDEEWVESRHPEMTGDERDSGFFLVSQTESLVVQLEFGAESPHAVYEEFGTIHREAHYPIRNTLDRVGYRVTDVLREEARRAFGGG
jgi:hypothetical protein